MNPNSYNRVCRLCLKNESLLDIFNEDTFNILAQKISSCVSVEILKSDIISKLICASCVHKINKWYNFKKMCQNTQVELNFMIKGFCVNKESEKNLNVLPQIKEEPLDLVIVDVVGNVEIGDDTNPINCTENVEIPPVSKSEYLDSVTMDSEITQSDNNTLDENTSQEKVNLGSNKATDLSDSQKQFVMKYKHILWMILSNSCNCCKITFGNEKKLLKHIKRHYNIPSFQCYKCLTNFQARNRYTRHKMNSLCNLNAITKKMMGEYLDDIDDSDKDKSFGCKACSTTFKLLSQFKQHVKEVHATKHTSLKCSHCQIEFVNEKIFTEHITNSLCLFFVKCDCCNTEFINSFKYFSHKCASKQLPPDCKSISTAIIRPLCSGNDTKESTLNEIDKTVELNNEKVIIKNKKLFCEICHTCFSHVFNLNKHMLIHKQNGFVRQTKNTKYYCEHCDMIFGNSIEYSSHAEIVHNIKKIPRENVTENTKTRRKVNDTAIEKTETYICGICKQPYSTRLNLLKHTVSDHMSKKAAQKPKVIKPNNGNVWLFCKYCKRKIKKNVLMVHMKEYHKNELVVENRLMKKYNKLKSNTKLHCCGIKFKSRDEFYEHKRCYHASVMHRCRFCPKAYIVKTSVFRHEKKCHLSF